MSLGPRVHAPRPATPSIQLIPGHVPDPRELVDIPEVRNLLRRLEAAWPYWAYFFNQVDDSIMLLLSCAANGFLERLECLLAFAQPEVGVANADPRMCIPGVQPYSLLEPNDGIVLLTKLALCDAQVVEHVCVVR